MALTLLLKKMITIRIAEEIIFGEDKVTTGAASDIEQATKRARAMVMRAGLSKELGPVAYGENEEEVFLGRSVARQQNMSEETARKCRQPKTKTTIKERVSTNIVPAASSARAGILGIPSFFLRCTPLSLRCGFGQQILVNKSSAARLSKKKVDCTTIMATAG